MRLLDRLSAYSFNLYYVKGRDMILADYLSRHRNKDIDPSELIPISFCCMNVFRGLLETEHGLEVYVVHPQDHLLSRQLHPTFPPAWRERGTIRL